MSEKKFVPTLEKFKTASEILAYCAVHLPQDVGDIEVTAYEDPKIGDYVVVVVARGEAGRGLYEAVSEGMQEEVP